MKVCADKPTAVYLGHQTTMGKPRDVDSIRGCERPEKEVTMQHSTSDIPFLQPIDEKRLCAILTTVSEMDRQILSSRALRNIPQTAHLLTDLQCYVHEKLGELGHLDRCWLVRFLLEEYPDLIDLAGLNDALAQIEQLEAVGL